MESWQARVDSFKKGKRVKKGSSTTVLRWPHPNSFLANPETLAEAGFYFKPSANNPDGVTCFMCGKELSDWEAEDDPFAEHVKRGRSCCWAIARCGLIEDMDDDGNFVFPDPSRLPSSKFMEKARMDSYVANWPHDVVKGHSASSKKMAKAGFIYTPQGPEDDTATCFYCSTSLSGWDDGDDPLEEHRKREAKASKPCPFLTSTQPKPVGRPASRTQARPPSRSALTSKKKTSTVAQEEEDNSPLSSADEGTLATTSRPRASTATRKTRSSSVPAKTPASSSRKSTRTSTATKAASRGTAGFEPEDDAEASGSEAGKRVSKTKRKAGKAKEKEHIEAIQEEEEGTEFGGFDDKEIEPEPEPEPAPAPKKRGRPPKKTTVAAKAAKKAPVEEPEPPEDEDESGPAKKQTQKRTHSKAKADTEDEMDLLSTTSSKGKSSTKSKAKTTPAANTSMPPPPVPSKLASSSKSSGKKPQRVVSEDDEDDGPEPEPKRTVVSKIKGRTKPRVVEESEDELAAPVEDEEVLPAPTKKPAPSASIPSSSRLEAGLPTAKNRKSSSTSDDAGYVTAEVAEAERMQVDAETEPEQGVRKRTSSSSKQSRTQDVAVVQPSRSSSELLTQGSLVDPSGRPPSRAGSIRPFARSSSRPVGSLAVRPLSRVAQEIVDISDSDDEPIIKAAPKPKKAVNGAMRFEVKAERDEVMVVDGAEASMSVQMALPATQKPPSKARMSKPPSKLQKFQVEIVVPPPSSGRVPPPFQEEDVEMRDDIDTAEPEPASSRRVVAAPKVASPVETALSGATPATPPPRTPSLSPPDTEAPKSKAGPPALPSFDEEMEAESAQQLAPPQTDDDALASFTPVLSILPLQRLTSLTAEECDMTLEQYIRREIEREYEQFKADGERRIAQFREKAAEARRVIESA